MSVVWNLISPTISRDSESILTDDLKSLVIVSRDACRVWIALELGLNFGEHIVDLDLFPVHPRTNKDDIYANTIWNPVRVFEWFAFTCVYPLVKRGNHLIITQDDDIHATKDGITRSWGTLDLSHLKNGNAIDRSVLDLKHTLGFRTPPLASTVERAPATINSNRLPVYWISSSSNNPLISADDLVFNYTPELPPTSYEISFNLK
ncbi:hypothetical protein BU15DRAFT_66587 [Melanogaster broomeanus]|nr:hypothetical protein BU15DRAFT_66587 [Melanogaster broomeanus]